VSDPCHCVRPCHVFLYAILETAELQFHLFALPGLITLYMFVFFQLEWKGLVLSFANPLLMVSGCSMAYIYQALENYSTYGWLSLPEYMHWSFLLYPTLWSKILWVSLFGHVPDVIILFYMDKLDKTLIIFTHENHRLYLVSCLTYRVQ